MLQDTLLSHHSVCLLTLPILLLLLLLFLRVTMHHRPGDTKDSAAARITRRVQGQTLCEVFGEDRTPENPQHFIHTNVYTCRRTVTTAKAIACRVTRGQ